MGLNGRQGKSRPPAESVDISGWGDVSAALNQAEQADLWSCQNIPLLGNAISNVHAVAWFALTGTLNLTTGSAQLVAGVNISNLNVTSANGAAVVALAYNNIQNSTFSTQPTATGSAGNTLTPQQLASASASVAAVAYGSVNDVTITAAHNVMVAAQQGAINVRITAGEMAGQVYQNDPAGLAAFQCTVAVTALGAITTADITATYGSVKVEGAAVSGEFTGKDVAINATGNAIVQITASDAANVSAAGTVSGSITSDGIARVTATGDVSMAIDADWGIGVTTWGGLSGDLTSSEGSIGVEAYGNVTSDTIEAGNAIDVVCWGNLNSPLTAGPEKVPGTVFAANKRFLAPFQTLFAKDPALSMIKVIFTAPTP